MRITNGNMNLKITPKNAVLLLLLTLLMVFPAISSNAYILGVLISANIFAVFAASWDLMAGVTGQFSFGQALFFGIAGYVSGALNLYLELPPWLTILMGGAVGMLVGVIVALPSLRLKGPYFVIVSLAFPVILAGIIDMYSEANGSTSALQGLSLISGSTVITYYASLLLMLISIFILLRILSSRIGLVLRSIRDDEDVAESSGINTTKYKLLAWAISGFFAGIAGGFYTHQVWSVSTKIFGLSNSFDIILFAILGGFGTIIGSVGGSYLMRILHSLLEDIVKLSSLIPVIYAVFMIIVFLFIPQGIYRWLATRFDIQIGTWSGLKQLRRKKLDGSNP